MNCCQCQGIEYFFDEKNARNELRKYIKKGPAKTTRLLIEGLAELGLTDKSLLDIGGGIGALQHELLSRGVSGATSVDASSAYLKVATEESQRRGFAGRVDYRHGDFIDQIAEVQPHHLVTLDRVICCYHDMPGLVGLSSDCAAECYGLVYPKSNWWNKLGFRLANLMFKLRGRDFRVFIHETESVDALLNQKGFQRCFHRQTILWQVVVYRRNLTE